MKDDDDLFLRTLQDLEAKASSYDRHELIRASAWLRRMFLEKHPLMVIVNVGRDVDVSFLEAVA